MGNSLLQVDLFGETASFQIEGKSYYGSIHGAIISIGILATVIAYGLNKYNIMLDFGETSHQ